jgi:hypothetical protein
VVAATRQRTAAGTVAPNLDDPAEARDSEATLVANAPTFRIIIAGVQTSTGLYDLPITNEIERELRQLDRAQFATNDRS